MTRFLFVLVLVGAGAVGLGYYRGWFHVSSDSADSNPNITFSTDPDKIQDDKKTALAKMHNLGGPAKDASSSRDGKAVSITGDKLVMTNGEGEEEHTYTLTADIKVTCDGKVCKAADLKPGMRVRVTTEKAEPHAATRIEALDNNRDFEKGA